MVDENTIHLQLPDCVETFKLRYDEEAVPTTHQILGILHSDHEVGELLSERVAVHQM